MSVPSSPSYSERLHVPLRWWALATMFLATVLIAFLVATPAWVACSVTAVMVAGTVALFLGYGGARVRVDANSDVAELHAGRAHIPVALLGVPVALDAAASRRLAGVDADARAYLLLRPYVSRSVHVPVQDPADPTPYWLVSSRRPDRLVAALVAAGAPSGAPARPTD